MRVVDPSVSLIWVTPQSLSVIEKAGRTCYKSAELITATSAAKFFRMLVRRGHEAMVEHAAASFRWVTDRGVTHELVRHRLASFAQESTRYCNYSKGKFGGEITVIKPPFKEGRIVAYEAWLRACESAEKEYMTMLECGCAPQIARAVLPQCTKAEIVMTANFREWRHVFKLRTSEAVHPQMREMASATLQWFAENIPVVVEDLI